MSEHAADLGFMAQALRLAEQGLYTTDPNPRVGCVLVNGGRVVGEGGHRRAGEPHAEAVALLAAGAHARGATAYVTLEPCSHTGRTPPCADALIAAGIKRVVAASGDPNPCVAGAGFSRLRAAGIAVESGAMDTEARRLNPGFFSRHERLRPFVRLKLAASLDGRTALADGTSHWITGEAARADVQAYRARSSAVLTGSGTVRADDPQLNVRLDYGPWIRQPLRVILDSSLAISPHARVLEGSPTLIFAAADAGERTLPGVSVERVARAPGGVDLRAVMRRLGEREVNELLVECGPRLAASFIAQRLIDELLIYVAPILLGADARALVASTGLDDLARAMRFEINDVARIGADLRLILSPRAG